MKKESADSLKVSVRCGCRAKARQMRLTVVWLRPERWAMDRVLQWVASLGVDSSVSVITRSTSSSVTARGRPLRGSSDRPSNRRSKNRERHFPTVSSDTSKSAATLTSLRGRLFRDADFAEFYCPDNGRDSVPPSLLATALLLQSHDKVSDAEAKARADFDLRWKVALGIEVEERPFAKSTLQVFRAHLILHDKVREVFEGSLRLARESGYLKGRGMRVALDTTNILGRGAVKDTCNLLADGIVKLLRALAVVEQAPVREWAQARGYERYLGSSVKGEAAIDWSDRQARTALLAGIVADADRLLELSRQAQGELREESTERQRIVVAAEPLGQLLLQDVERAEGGVSLKDGVRAGTG